ncbi:MAG: stage III sporulation protein AA [Clostridium sp.]|jgi:stage III sporulation protein AA|nr:stage III sporulation protein AA [Clostridium sp.]
MLFPIGMREYWRGTAADADNVQEIRLRCNLPIQVIRGGRERFLDEKGFYTDKPEQARRIEGAQIREILRHICHYSPYAYEDEIRQGFLTVSGGHRVGVAGQTVLEGETGVRTIKNISYLNIRVSHQIKGAGDQVLPHLYRDGEIQNTLIISPPGCGKTTLLRDLVRQVSDGNAYGGGRCVGVVDERSEIAGCFLGIPQNDVGMRTDVLDACPKALGMMMLLRAMAPQVIAIDELGGKKDAEALRLAASCGSRILATIHGSEPDDIRRKEGMDRLFREGIFRHFVILTKKNGRCAVKTILGREEAYAACHGERDGNSRLFRSGVLVPAAVCAEDPAAAYDEPDHGNDDE